CGKQGMHRQTGGCRPAARLPLRLGQTCAAAHGGSLLRTRGSTTGGSVISEAITVRRQLVIVMSVTAVVLGGAAAFPLYRWLAEDRKGREQVREAHIQQSLARLTAANPRAYFARYPPDGEPVLFGASFYT